MLTSILIGHIGADAVAKTSNGRTFLTFRVCHTSVWTGADGQENRDNIWVDCIMNDNPNLRPHLTKGTHVYVSGNVSLRVYSSKKDRCMKAGMTISVKELQLLGGNTDAVPLLLYRGDNQQEIRTKKFFWSSLDELPEDINTPLYSRNGAAFYFDSNGFIYPQSQPTGDSEQGNDSAVEDI